MQNHIVLRILDRNKSLKRFLQIKRKHFYILKNRFCNLKVMIRFYSIDIYANMKQKRFRLETDQQIAITKH